MKINIVYPGEGHPKLSAILPRLAHMLADETGWTLSDEPDDEADLNYFFPYLLHEEGYTKTMTAAWFTHREEDWPEKAAIWDRVARQVDLRLVSTEHYYPMLEELGLTNIVTPPIDEIFRPVEVAGTTKRQIVGISGYVYNQSGRKGEGLVKQLAETKFAKSITLKAIGRNWPVPCELVSYENLPLFYSSLDVYLCTSTIEGPGYGPLEALACGTKVVIPWGVGIFDELPDIPGIVRYRKGDYGDMLKALKSALAQDVDPKTLTDAVSLYTAEAWAVDHEWSMRNLFTPRIVEPSSNVRTPDNAGVFMVAFGKPARACATKAVESWRKFMPDVKVAIASDEPLGDENNFICLEDGDLGARGVKTNMYDLAPMEWEFVVYVDADTELTADVSFLFDVLVDGWEMFICYNPAKFVLGRNMVRGDNKDECEVTFDQIGTDEFLQYNGGVLGFRRCHSTELFFRAWHTEWERWGKRDQAALDRALHKNPVRILTLGSEWNTITRYQDAARTSGILHYPTLARRWSSIIRARLDSPEAWREAGLQ